MMFVDENGAAIDITAQETTEQEIAKTFIEPDSVVLELGARYGTVSCVINKRLSNPLNQVSVEPDRVVWSELETNRQNHSCLFHIVKGFISNKTMSLDGTGYGMTGVFNEKSDIPSYSLKNIEEQFGLRFDTLVIDCEGCFENFLDENPQLLQQLKTITFEHDVPDKCNYTKIIESLKNAGFSMVYNNNDFHTVWKKQA